MTIAYFDCFSGISGDMILGALVDCGLDPEALRQDLKALPIPGLDIQVERVRKCGIAATKVTVVCPPENRHRHLKDIVAIIEEAELPSEVKSKSIAAFRRLAEAEAQVHGIAPEKVHFHEVGAADAIADVVGCFSGLHRLGVSRVWSSPLAVGSGYVTCQHGRYPVPAPATALLLTGVPVYAGEVEAELVTPTGACLITSVAERFERLPALIPRRVGYGAGERDFPVPNVLRLILASEAPSSGASPRPPVPGAETDWVDIIETTVDDMNPEFYPPLLERLFQAGALDVYLTPVTMKRGRPGQTVTVMCYPQRTADLARLLLRESTTLGLRIRRTERVVASRRWLRVALPEGPVRVKISEVDGEVCNVAPEVQDCEQLASRTGGSVKGIYERAKAAALAGEGEPLPPPGNERSPFPAARSGPDAGITPE